jgi:hypothetical protein
MEEPQLDLGIEPAGSEPTPMAGRSTKMSDEILAARVAVETKAIDEFNELSKFLDTATVRNCFADLGKQYTAEWLDGVDVTAREETWAKARALLDLAKDLRSVYDRGRQAKATRRKRQAREVAPAKRRKR